MVRPPSARRRMIHGEGGGWEPDRVPFPTMAQEDEGPEGMSERHAGDGDLPARTYLPSLVTKLEPRALVMLSVTQTLDVIEHLRHTLDLLNKRSK